MKKDVVLKKNPDMVTRQIDEETILVPVLKTSDEMNCIYTLNESASVVWDMIDGKKTIEDIKKEIVKKFDVVSKDAHKKLQGVIKDLKEINAIK